MSSSASALLSTLRTCFDPSKADLTPANTKLFNETLTKLKIEMTTFQLLPPFPEQQLSTIQQQLTIARETLELATFFAIHTKDVKAFERYVAQLKVFYNDYSELLSPSERQASIVGLSLLSLLARNQIADFHTEVELLNNHRNKQLTQTLLATNSIQYPIQLEQYLMEGAYNKILTARSSVPMPAYAFFMDMLVDTVRDKIADCSEVAYESFPLKDASRLLMLTNDSDVQTFLNKRNWTVKGDQVYFNRHIEQQVEIPAWKTISQTLEYATELERIV